MSSINKSMLQMIAIEELAHKDSPLHRLASLVKLLVTIVYVIVVISFEPENLNGLLLYACFPVFFMMIGDIPMRPFVGRCLFALPFALFAGLSNLILSRNVIMQIGTIEITVGMITFTSLLFKTVLTVMAVLILVSTTMMNDMIYALLKLRVPSVFIILVMMTYRYLVVLAEEASLMYYAYLLRAPREKGIKLKDMGSFLGQLILRSFDRADRIYHAMQCRGFEGRLTFSRSRRIRLVEWLVLFIMIILIIVLRFLNIGELIGKLWVG